jgi:predicted RNase H-like nuclease (RuvC/YqgF family)
MGVVEDSRKIIQDFLAPELRAVGARLEALEKQVTSLETNVNRQFGSLETSFNRQLSSLETNMNRQFQDLRTAFEFDKRLSRIEAELADKKSA